MVFTAKAETEDDAIGVQVQSEVLFGGCLVRDFLGDEVLQSEDFELLARVGHMLEIALTSRKGFRHLEGDFPFGQVRTNEHEVRWRQRHFLSFRQL